jgi:hypothetical protein
MSTACAFLSQTKIVIIVDGMVRAGVNTAHASGAFLRVDNNQSIISLIDSSLDRTGGKTGSAIAMHTQRRPINDAYFRNSSFFFLGNLDPELPSIRLGFSIRRPIVAAMFIFAGYLAIITSAASGYIY